MRARIGIVGFRGYSGSELARILSRHPRLEPVLLEHREEAEPIRIEFRGLPKTTLSKEAIKHENLKAVALATPPGASMELAPMLLDAGVKVVDLSGAFRLKGPGEYQRWYKEGHREPALLREAVYGLPEFFRDKIPGARLVANPGCYPTAANLAIQPLIEADIIDRSHGIVCDAKSGVSGAGRKASLSNSFCEVAENFSAYSVLGHRHVPEILQISGLEEAELSFTAQLLPVDRGILETIYFRTKTVLSAEDLAGIYARRYRNEPFLRLWPAGRMPDLRSVAHTNFCDIGLHYDAQTRRAVVVAAIDNLVKGAAGQATQNLNLALGLEEPEGLL